MVVSSQLGGASPELLLLLLVLVVVLQGENCCFFLLVLVVVPSWWCAAAATATAAVEDADAEVGAPAVSVTRRSRKLLALLPPLLPRSPVAAESFSTQHIPWFFRRPSRTGNRRASSMHRSSAQTRTAAGKKNKKSLLRRTLKVVILL